MIRRLKNKRGFTLVELMIVVAIIGILATLAIYGVKTYMTNSKTGEAKANLGRLGKDAVAAYEKENMASALLGAGASVVAVHRLCPDAAAVPAAVPAAQKTQPDPASWNDSATGGGWSCLKFAVNSPVYYQYAYDQINATSFNTTATGDLDGDTTTSAWAYGGALVAGTNTMRLAPTIAEPAATDE